MPKAGAKLAAAIPKISIGKRAAKGRVRKDPENKPRKEKVSPETDP